MIQDYEVSDDNGKMADYSANIIAENIYEQVDNEGQSWAMIDEIVDHFKTKDTLRQEE